MAENKAKRDWVLIAVGVLMIICGGIIAAFPGLTLVTVAAFAGASFLVAGVGNVVAFFKLRKTGNASVLTLIYAAIDIVVGLMMLLHPLMSAAVVPWLVALCFGVMGIFEIVSSQGLRKAGQKAWSWICVSGLVSLACAVMLFMFPVLLAAMFSIIVAVRGVGMIVFGFTAGKYEA